MGQIRTFATRRPIALSHFQPLASQGWHASTSSKLSTWHDVTLRHLSAELPQSRASLTRPSRTNPDAQYFLAERRLHAHPGLCRRRISDAVTIAAKFGCENPSVAQFQMKMKRRNLPGPIQMASVTSNLAPNWLHLTDALAHAPRPFLTIPFSTTAHSRLLCSRHAFRPVRAITSGTDHILVQPGIDARNAARRRAPQRCRHPGQQISN